MVKEGEDDHILISQGRCLAYREPQLRERNINSSFNYPLRPDRVNCSTVNDFVSRAIGGLVFAERDEKSCEISPSPHPNGNWPHNISVTKGREK